MQDKKELHVYSILQKTELGSSDVFTIQNYTNNGNIFKLGGNSCRCQELG